MKKVLFFQLNGLFRVQTYVKSEFGFMPEKTYRLHSKVEATSVVLNYIHNGYEIIKGGLL